MFPENFSLVAARAALRARVPVLLSAVALLLLLAVPACAPAQNDSAALPAGVTLPIKGGTYAVQAGQDGVELIRLHASEIVSNSHAGSNFARSMVYAGPHSTVELDGINASAHLKGAKLSFLVRLSDDSPDLMLDRVALIRLQQTDKRRVVSTYSQNIFGGQHKRQYDIVETTKAEVGDANASWALVTPVQPLGPGEYGIVFLPKDPNLFFGEVYDFNVDFEKAKPDTAKAH